MSKSNSSSNSESSTANYDNRIVNESGIVVGPGAVYTNNLPEEAGAIFKSILDFAGDTLKEGLDVIEEQIQGNTVQSQALISSNNAAISQSQLGNSSLIKDLIPVLVIGAIGVTIFLTFRKAR